MRIRLIYKEKLVPSEQAGELVPPGAEGGHVLAADACHVEFVYGERLEMVQSVSFALNAVDLVPKLVLEVIPAEVVLEGECQASQPAGERDDLLRMPAPEEQQGLRAAQRPEGCWLFVPQDRLLTPAALASLQLQGFSDEELYREMTRRGLHHPEDAAPASLQPRISEE